jgi:hypothetical protein
MVKVSTSIYVDSVLWEEADKKGIDRSSLIDEALRKALNKGETLNEINDRMLPHITALEELERQKSELIEKEKEKYAILEGKAKEEAELEARDKAQKTAEKLAILKQVPEILNLKPEQLNNNRFMMDWIDNMRIRYPNLKFGILDVKKYKPLLDSPDAPQKL